MRVTAIGAANIDIIVKSKSAIATGESNPADVSLKAGGVARNIAAMLALRGVEVDTQRKRIALSMKQANASGAVAEKGQKPCESQLSEQQI